MWTLVVIFGSPVGDFAARVPQIPKPTRIEAFVAQPSVKTFNVSILGRLSGLDVDSADTSLDTPG